MTRTDDRYELNQAEDMIRTDIRTGGRALAVLAAAALSFPAPAGAEKFKRAEVTKVVNDVRLLTGTATSRPASRGAVVSGSTAVRTGQKSRTELQFPDESVVRLGSNSVFSFLQGKREVDLKQGTLLMQVPKSLGRTRV
ncbi:MAG: FecR domain-containing protein, partial [Verrucomicrobiales bacterium]